MKKSIRFKTPLSNGFFWGITGGLLWLLIRFLPLRIAIAEIAMLIVYALVMILSVITFKPDRMEKIFVKMFLSSLLVFMLVPVTTHAGIILILKDTMPLNELVGPFFIMLGLGIGISSLLAYLIVRRRRNRTLWNT